MNQKVLLDRDIDRTSPEPFYLQLSRAIEDAIDRGEFAPGERIPAESELCRTFDLARSTVRATLRALENRNRIRVVPRRGAFVTDPDQSGWVLQVAAGFFEGEVNNDNRSVETMVLSAERAPFNGAAADALHLPQGVPGFLLRRLRKLDGRIALFSINYLLAELEDIVRDSAVLQSNGSLNRTLSDAGYRIYGAKRTVEAVPASEEIAALLDVAVASPVLLVSSTSWDKNGRPFDYYTTWVRTDVVKVTVQAEVSRNNIQGQDPASSTAQPTAYREKPIANRNRSA